MHYGMVARKFLLIGLMLEVLASSLAWNARQALGEDTGRASTTRQKVTIRGEGKNREMLISGRITGVDNPAIIERNLVILFKRQNTLIDLLPPIVHADRFEVWVPIGGTDWSRLLFSFTTKDGKHRAFHGISQWEYRQAAIEGVELRLQPADRKVTVRVTHEDVPLQEAHVCLKLMDSLTLDGQTDGQGEAIFHLCEGQSVMSASAWTNSPLVGGFSVYRKPLRDPFSDKFEVELTNARDQVFRLVNADDQTPIPGVEFLLTLGTGAPNYNFLGTAETLPGARMVTDEKGEALFRLFPDWEKHGTYVETVGLEWFHPNGLRQSIVPDKGETMLVKLKRGTERRPLLGQIHSNEENLEGFQVTASTFQAEEDGKIESLYTVTDSQGRFLLNCLPGVTYCVSLHDHHYASPVSEVVIGDSHELKVDKVDLQISKGRPIEIHVTSGPDHKPIPFQYVNLSVQHRYSWIENGDRKYGTDSRSWGVITDQDGVARTWALAGAKLNAIVYRGEWRSNETEHTVLAKDINRIEIHQQYDSEREITGQLVASPDLNADLRGAIVVAGSVDGEFEEELTAEVDEQGRFTLKTKSVSLGIMAYTADGQAAGSTIITDTTEFFEVPLHKTGSLQGQLLTSQGSPISHHEVNLEAIIQGKRQGNFSRSTYFFVNKLTTTTNGNGEYSFKDLPSGMVLWLSTITIDDHENQRHLREIFLEPGESRIGLSDQLRPSQLRSSTAPSSDTRLLSHRMVSNLRDAVLGDYHLLVLIGNESADPLVEKILDTENRVLNGYLNLRIGNVTSQTENQDFLKTHKWPLPHDGHLFVCAVDQTGEELGRIELDVNDLKAETLAAEFIIEHAPPTADAEQKWKAAFDEAQRSNRKVWARISHRYCGPCFSFARWLDDQSHLLDQDYVLLKIDTHRDKNAEKIQKRITRNVKLYGVPFHAIYDSEENFIINSMGPLGNIGHPTGVESGRHLRKMLTETRSNLTDEQIDALLQSLAR